MLGAPQSVRAAVDPLAVSQPAVMRWDDLRYDSGGRFLVMYMHSLESEFVH